MWGRCLAFEAVEGEEVGAVTGDVGGGFDILGGEGFHEFVDFGLDVGFHFPVVNADAAGFVDGHLSSGGVEAVAEEAVDLVEAVFVGAVGLHHLEEAGDVGGHGGNDGGGAGHEGLVDGDDAEAADVGEHFGDGFTGGFEVFLGAAEGAGTVDVLGALGADVGVGDGLAPGREEALGLEVFHPEDPVFTAHDLDGGGDFFVVGGVDGDFLHLAGHDVKGARDVGLADGLDGALVEDAGLGVGAHGRGEGVDDAIEGLEAVFLGEFGDLGAGFVGEGVGGKGHGLEALGLGGFIEGFVVVPTGGAGLAVGGFAFEGDAEGVGLGAAEGDCDAGGEAVTAGAPEHEDALGAVLEGGLCLFVVRPDPLLAR